jgi:hypothetical protein
VGRRAIIATVAAAVGIASGCGSGGTTTVVQRTVTHTSSAPAPSTTSSTSTTTATEQATSPPRRLSSFQTPSGNIACGLARQSARCDIKDRSWTPPPKPASCPLDWGQGLVVSGSGKGQVVCAGDTVLNPDAPVLDYGERAGVGGVVCDSESSGVTCTSGAGHGFFISRESYRLF